MCTYVCIGHFPWEPPLIFRLLSYIYEKPPKLKSNGPVRLAVINYNSEKKYKFTVKIYDVVCPPCHT